MVTPTAPAPTPATPAARRLWGGKGDADQGAPAPPPGGGGVFGSARKAPGRPAAPVPPPPSPARARESPPASPGSRWVARLTTLTADGDEEPSAGGAARDGGGGASSLARPLAAGLAVALGSVGGAMRGVGGGGARRAGIAAAAVLAVGALVVPRALGLLGGAGGAGKEARAVGQLFRLAERGLRGRSWVSVRKVGEAMQRAGVPEGLSYRLRDARVAEMGMKGLMELTGRDFAASRHGQSAAHHAAAHGHVDVIQALREAGADVGLPDAFGRTAVHYAAASGHTEALSALMGLGLKLSARDKHGRSAVHYLTIQACRGMDRVVRGDWTGREDAEAGLSGLYLVALLVPLAPLRKMCAVPDRAGANVPDRLLKARGALVAFSRSNRRPKAGSKEAAALRDLLQKLTATMTKCG